MTTGADLQALHPLLRFLARELAPREGRGALVARISAGCAITVAIAMLFRIPQPAYMAYIVILISKEQSATAKSAIGASLAVTLALALCLLLFILDAAEPALRLPAMIMTTFMAMYSSRVFALGPISFLAGFVLVLVQSLVDDVPNLEFLTRTTLWLWVVVFVPVSVSLLLNLLFGPGTAAYIERSVSRVLLRLESCLLDPDARFAFAEERAEMLATLTTFRGQSGRARGQQVITENAILRLLDALTMLEGLEADLPIMVGRGLAQRVRAIRLLITRGKASAESPPVDNLWATLSPAALVLDDTFAALSRQLGCHPAPLTPATRGARSLFVADAFTNPEYLRFALKSTMAVMTVYVIYTLLDYPGMRTSIVTCFFVSLGTLAETVHKLLLRISGAIIGGLGAALCIMFLLPHLTDIGQLCLLIAVVAGGCAWVATSSERLAYAGLQIAFAFFLGVLHGYAPATDLTALRDRVAGILLGNVVITIIFSVFWPESATTRLRAALTDLLRALAALLRSDAAASDGARLRVTMTQVRVEKYDLLQDFELRMLATARTHRNLHRWLPSLGRLAGATLIASSASVRPYAFPRAMDRRAAWAEEAAAAMLESGVLPPAPMRSDVPLTPAQLADHAVQTAIENVVGTPT